ncbi:replication initiator, partial [Streptomyces coeruleorubidus]
RPCRCGTHHDQDDDALGTPLDPDTYDYEAAVLWNAHTGPLWQRFSTYHRSADFNGGQELTERAVAAYIAKYATKGAETATGALDRPLKFAAELTQLDISDHARRLIRTAWTLGARKDLEHLRLRAWAHMLGFRGHFSTKSRRYSTTLGALRDARAKWRRAQAAAANGAEPDTTYVLAHWIFAGTGLSDTEAWLAASLEPAPGTEGEPTRG